MKISKNKSSKKAFIIIVAVLLLAIVAVYAYIFMHKPEDKNNPQTNVPTVQESTEPEDTTNTDVDNSTDKEDVKTPTKTPGKTPSQYEGETVDDEPAYDNEQFRIPEEDM